MATFSLDLYSVVSYYDYMSTEIIRVQTSRGEAMVEITYSGCFGATATLDGKVIGTAIFPLKTAVERNGKILIASCGSLGLTAEDMTAIKTAEIAAKNAWDASPEGIAAKAEQARLDRIAERNEQLARESDINKWEDA